MENLLFSLFSAFLFFIISPGILLRLPKNGNKYTVGAVHAVVFAVILYLTSRLFLKVREGVYTGFKYSFDDAKINMKVNGIGKYYHHYRCGTGPKKKTTQNLFNSNVTAKNCKDAGGNYTHPSGTTTARCNNAYEDDAYGNGNCNYLYGELFYRDDWNIEKNNTDFVPDELSTYEKAKEYLNKIKPGHVANSDCQGNCINYDVANEFYQQKYSEEIKKDAEKHAAKIIKNANKTVQTNAINVWRNAAASQQISP